MLTAALSLLLTGSIALARTASALPCAEGDDACAADDDDSNILLQSQASQFAAENAQRASPGGFDIQQFKAAFDSPDGVLLRVTSPEERSSSATTSVTAWRNDVPLALYAPPHNDGPPDSSGIVLIPKNVKHDCAYATNAETVVRVTYTVPKKLVWTRVGVMSSSAAGLNVSVGDPVTDDQIKKMEALGLTKDILMRSCMEYENIPNACGADIKSSYSFLSDPDMGGECDFMDDPWFLAGSYYFKPIVKNSFGGVFWSLQYNMCHFKKISSAIDAQKALLTVVASAPPGVNESVWLANATKADTGVTVFNEIVAKPYGPNAVGAVFWAHEGPFREPQLGDPHACEIGKYVSKSGSDRPIIELAWVNLHRPYSTCVGNNTGNCLRAGYEEWQRNLTGGVRDATSFARMVDESMFKALFANGCTMD